MQESSNSFRDQEFGQEQQKQRPTSSDQSETPDFFNELQQNENRKGVAARGKGHGWTTLIELLMGDW